MSSNFSDFDFLFNVEPGKKLTQDQMIKNYEEYVAQNSGEDISIFGTNANGFIGEMFEFLNTKKSASRSDGVIEEEVLDEEELAALRAFSSDGDGNKSVTNDDMSALMQKTMSQLSKKYADMQKTTKEKMYSEALEKAGGDMRNSSFIQDLTNEINELESMISLRQNSSNNLISEYQSQIDEMVRNSTKLSNDFKRDYAETKNKVAAEQDKLAKTQLKIRSNESKIREFNLNHASIKQQIDGMSEEEKENNPKLLSDLNSELAGVQSNSDDLAKENQSLLAECAKYSLNLTNAKSKLSKLTKQSQEEDSNIKNRISELKVNVSAEEQSCKSKIDDYTARIEFLTQVRDYAIQQMMQAQNANSSYDFGNDAVLFEELEQQLAEQGLQYNQEKGRALADDVYSHRVGFTGYCARYVCNALQRQDLCQRRGNGEQMDDILRQDIESAKARGETPKFIEVKITSPEQLSSLPPGCVVVYEKGAAGYNSQYGHVEITMGDGTAVSDGLTRNMRYCKNMSVFIPVTSA